MQYLSTFVMKDLFSAMITITDMYVFLKSLMFQACTKRRFSTISITYILTSLEKLKYELKKKALNIWIVCHVLSLSCVNLIF